MVDVGTAAGVLRLAPGSPSPCLPHDHRSGRRCSHVRVERSQPAHEPKTLAEAYAVMPMSPPADASPGERAAFHRARAEMFTRVSKSDPDRKHEAMANAWLEREKAKSK